VAIAAALVLLIAAGSPSIARGTGSCGQRQHPGFESFPAKPIFSGRRLAPILATALDRKHRTAIRQSLANGPNFASHFVIAAWGCGTGCQEFVIIDASTGIVHDPPFDKVDYHYPQSSDVRWQCYSDLLTYRKDSLLLVAEGCLKGKQCGRTYYVMKNGLKQIAYDPDLLPDGKIAPF
jgi:hypothetical protein